MNRCVGKYSVGAVGAVCPVILFHSVRRPATFSGSSLWFTVKLRLHQSNMLSGNKQHVAGKHVACCWQHVACISAKCIHLYPAKDWQQTGNNFVAGNKHHVAQQHVALV